MSTTVSLNQFQWNSAAQPLHKTPEEYLDLAERLRPVFDAQLAFAFDSAGVEGVHVSPSVLKPLQSAQRKMQDKSDDSAQIRDYLRTEGVTGANNACRIASVESLSKAIEMIKRWDCTLGWKDRFSHPEPETGYRDFKAHIFTENPENPKEAMVTEIKLIDAAMENSYAESEEIRHIEREYLRAVRYGSTARVRTQAQFVVSASRALRKTIHDEAASAAGINTLITNPDYIVAESDADKIVASLQETGYGRKSIPHITRAIR